MKLCINQTIHSRQLIPKTVFYLLPNCFGLPIKQGQERTTKAKQSKLVDNLNTDCIIRNRAQHPLKTLFREL
jgi:hypothetical protein